MEHRQRTIARTRNTRIDQCTCGAIHLSVGSTTIRISEAAARELKDALARAIDDVDARAAANDTVSGPGYQITLTGPGPGDDDGDGGPQMH